MKKTITITLIVFISNLCHAIDNSSALSFFENYQKLSKEFNPEVISLYSDEAKISSLREYPSGQTREISMTGKEFKELLKKVLPLAKARGDISHFSEIQISIESNTARISAHRYSQLKDYTDESYYMVIKEIEDQKLMIIKEHTGTRP